jgi:RNA polymerase sigma factor (sigma-70 family)
MSCFTEKDIPEFMERMRRFLGNSYRRSILGADYEDAVQDTIMALIQNHKKNHDRALDDPKSYLYRVAKNKVAKKAMHLATRPKEGRIKESPDDKSGYDIFRDKRFIQGPNQLSAVIVNSIFDKFTSEEQGLLIKIYLEKKSSGDIAKDLVKSRTYAYNKMIAVVAKLQKILVEEDNGL